MILLSRNTIDFDRSRDASNINNNINMCLFSWEIIKYQTIRNHETPFVSYISLTISTKGRNNNFGQWILIRLVTTFQLNPHPIGRTKCHLCYYLDLISMMFRSDFKFSQNLPYNCLYLHHCKLLPCKLQKYDIKMITTIHIGPRAGQESNTVLCIIVTPQQLKSHWNDLHDSFQIYSPPLEDQHCQKERIGSFGQTSFCCQKNTLLKWPKLLIVNSLTNTISWSSWKRNVCKRMSFSTVFW